MNEEEEFEFRARAEREARGSPAMSSPPTVEEEPLIPKVDPNSYLDALKRGVVTGASKVTRGVGTTLLPKSMEKRAEEAGYLPSQQFIQDLENSARDSKTAQITSGVVGALPEMLPMAKASRALTFLKAAPRVAAVGGIGGGVKSEEDDVASGALGGAAGAVAGEGIGRGVVNAANVTRHLPQAAKDTLTDAAFKYDRAINWLDEIAPLLRLHPKTAAAHRMFEAVRNRAGKQAAETVRQATTNPEYLASVLKSLPSNGSVPLYTIDALRRSGVPATIGAELGEQNAP